MKTKIYIRIGQHKNGRLSASASTKPNYDPLRGTKSYGNAKALPTLAFAVEFEFPDALLKQAEQVAAKINLEKKDAVVCGKITAP